MLRVISYNLLHSRAVSELVGLASTDAELDALCLQEVSPQGLPEHIGHLALVEHTRRNELALAVYVRTDRFDVRSTGTYEVKRSLARWEPRIEVLGVDVSLDAADRATLYIDIRYTKRGTNDPRNLVFPFYVIPEEG